MVSINCIDYESKGTSRNSLCLIGHGMFGFVLPCFWPHCCCVSDWRRRLSFPPLDDPAGYIQLARNIASGRGLVSDVLWNYWVPFPAVTHASNEFWMPLASVIMAGSLRLFGDTLLAAQLPGLVAGALLAPVVYLIGRTLWPRQRRWSVLAAALIVINAALIYQSSSVDSSAIYTLLATLALFCGALALDRRRVSWMALAGVWCGLSYLTRSHALLLPASIGLITLIVLRREPKMLIKLIGVLVLGFAVFLVPWWLRNLTEFGVTQPVPLTTIIASRGYEDWFNYTQQPTLASIAQAGLGHVPGVSRRCFAEGAGRDPGDDLSGWFDRPADRLVPARANLPPVGGIRCGLVPWRERGAAFGGGNGIVLSFRRAICGVGGAWRRSRAEGFV